MTEQFTNKELKDISLNEKTLKAAATVAIHTSQKLENLDVKIDTIGVSTIKQIKHLNEIKGDINKTKDLTVTLVEKQLDTIDVATNANEIVENVQKTVDNSKETIEKVSKTIEEIQIESQEKTAAQAEKLNDTNRKYLSDLENVNQNLETIQKSLKSLDYKEDLENLSHLVSVLNENVINYGDISEAKYDTISQQLNILEKATSTSLQAAFDYRNRLEVMQTQVQTLRSRIDGIEELVIDLRTRPTVGQQEDILELFKGWDADKEVIEIVTEVTTPEEVESVDTEEIHKTEEVIQESIVEEPVIKETPETKTEGHKKGLFSRLFK